MEFAGSKKVGELMSRAPQMTTAISGWAQTYTITRIIQSLDDNGYVKEDKIDSDLTGFWQPYSDEDLQLIPEGQRNWRWFAFHVQGPHEHLKFEEVVTIKDIDYRVMAIADFSDENYVEYRLVRDYDYTKQTNSGDITTIIP